MLRVFAGRGGVSGGDRPISPAGHEYDPVTLHTERIDYDVVDLAMIAISRWTQPIAVATRHADPLHNPNGATNATHATSC